MALMKSSDFTKGEESRTMEENSGRGPQSVSTQVTSYNRKLTCISEILKTLLNKIAYL